MLVILPSMTTISRVQRILAAEGIKSQTIHTTKGRGVPGCGHGLKISPADLPRVREVTAEIGSKIKAVIP